jgi:hypothetical protein
MESLLVAFCRLQVSKLRKCAVQYLTHYPYRDFLVSEGDLEVEVGEWKPFSLNVPEDVSKLNFSFTRTCTYLHPRTTMLMFGPKNAPAKQTQFLYLYGRGSGKISTFEDLKSCRPRRGVVLTMTQFDGIPMADMFKVLQYWGFEDHGSSDSPAVLMSIGVHIHFIKSTLLKGQIVSGVRDELAVLSKKYLTWSRSRIEEFILAEDNRTSVVTQVNSNPGPSVSVDAAVPPGTVAEQPKRVPRRLLNESVQHADEPLKHEAQDSSIGSHNAYLLSGIYGYVILGTLLVLILILFLMQRSTNRALHSHIKGMEERFDILEKLLSAKFSSVNHVLVPDHPEL